MKTTWVKIAINAENESENGNEQCHILIVQGKPIGEPVQQYGPFVMNNMAEIEEAFIDFRKSQFGGWPWPVK